MQSKTVLNSPRKNIKMTYTPSIIDQNQALIIKIPKIGSNEVLVTDTLKLSFNFDVSSNLVLKNDIVNNLARALIYRLEVKIGDQVVQDIYDYDIFHVYSDLWLTAKQRKKLIQQGIDDSQDINRNRIGRDDWAILVKKLLHLYTVINSSSRLILKLIQRQEHRITSEEKCTIIPILKTLKYNSMGKQRFFTTAA